MTLPTPHALHRTPRLGSGRGFTIVELLVAIAVIFILITTAYYALRSIRKSATRTESLNALRQILVAYDGYTKDHNNRFMPGFIDASLFNAGQPFASMRVRLRTGYELQPADKSSYVWRLSPYLDHAWQTFMVDYRSGGLLSAYEEEYDTGNAGGAFTNIAMQPSFGLNSRFLGGDHFPGGAELAFAAMTPSQVKNPSNMIAFAAAGAYLGSAATIDASTQVHIGHCRLAAPFGDYDPNTGNNIGPVWTIDPPTGNIIAVSAGFDAGVPIDRLSPTGEHVPLGNVDGSVGNDHQVRLSKDMTRWSPKALRSN